MVSGEVYLAEIDHQWAEKAASGLKDERLTPPYIGRLVRSLAAVLDWGVRKGYGEVLENASQEPRSICGRFCEVRTWLRRCGEQLLVLVVRMELALTCEVATNVPPFPPSAGRNREERVRVSRGVACAPTNLDTVDHDRTVLYLGVGADAVHRATRSPANGSVGEVEALTTPKFLHRHSRLRIEPLDTRGSEVRWSEGRAY